MGEETDEREAEPVVDGPELAVESEVADSSDDEDGGTEECAVVIDALETNAASPCTSEIVTN